MSGDPPVTELAATWWRTAKADSAAAKQLTTIPFACGFHCQQAVEKAIKCLLVLHQVEFPRSHEIGELLDVLAPRIAPPPDPDRADLEALTRFAVRTRYPPAAATPQEAADALGAAERFLAWVEAALPPEVTSPGG